MDGIYVQGVREDVLLESWIRRQWGQASPKAGTIPSAPCWAQGDERTRVLFDQNKILMKKLDNEAMCSFHSLP